MNLAFEFDDEQRRREGQYFTPPWLAHAIVERYFPWLGKEDVVCEPSCGLGAFLNAVPAEVTAYGVEVDEALAQRCETLTGRQVIIGRFEDVSLPAPPTAVIGNPPFKASVIEQFLSKSHALLPEEGAVGMIVPAYLLQTAGTVARLADSWSIQTDLIPRNVFPRLSKPLVFSLFRKNKQRTLIGLAFYLEAADVAGLPDEIQAIFTEQGAPMWPRVVEAALIALGGRARLPEIYRLVEGNRPTKTRFWREQVRRVLQERFVHLGIGLWGHPNAA